VVALAATERAVSHDVRRRALGIGAGRFGNCGTHPEPPTDFTQPHILQKSLPRDDLLGLLALAGVRFLLLVFLLEATEEAKPFWLSLRAEVYEHLIVVRCAP
jgi:hypothetical protein